MMGIPINSIPLSSTSPELDHSRSPLVGKIPINEPIRSKRSLTALLAAEVLFLEGILAAQNSQKGGSKVKARKVARSVTNHIHTAVHGKYTSNIHNPAYPTPVKEDITNNHTQHRANNNHSPNISAGPFYYAFRSKLVKTTEYQKEAFPQHEDAILDQEIVEQTFKISPTPATQFTSE